MTEYKGIGYLRTKLNLKRSRVITRYKYYDMKNRVVDFGTTIPPELKLIRETLGWCGTAVDSIADRLVFREFDNDNFNLNEIFALNNADVLFDSAVVSAVISSCCFIYISLDEDGYPRLQVVDGGNATGIIDEMTGMLKEGYAVLERDDNDNPTIEAYFIKGQTDIYANGEVMTIKNNAPYPLLVPIIYRPDASRPFGHSVITRACMDLTQSALRTLRRSEISAEFNSYPQKYVLGLSEDCEFDKWQATMSSMLAFTKDADGDRPSVGQFTQGSMSPYVDQMKMIASLFAGETGLTVADLGFATDNPSSYETIKASHENLRLKCRKAQRTFGSGFLNVGYLACCLRDDYPYLRKQLYTTKPIWEPIFEPDASTLSVIGDGAIKINQAVPYYFGADNLRNLTGIEPSKEV